MRISFPACPSLDGMILTGTNAGGGLGPFFANWLMTGSQNGWLIQLSVNCAIADGNTADGPSGPIFPNGFGRYYSIATTVRVICPGGNSQGFLQFGTPFGLSADSSFAAMGGTCINYVWNSAYIRNDFSAACCNNINFRITLTG